MYAREVEAAQSRLDELRLAEWEGLALAAVALGAAVASTQLWPQLAFPLFLGGMTIGALGIRAIWRRWDLVDRLTGERDAYVIPEVRAHASRRATLERRRSIAASIRRIAPAAGHPNEARLAAVAAELESLARKLEDEALDLDPATAVACLRLFSDESGRGPLFDELLPVDELRARIRHVESGFTPRRLAE